jgi:DNA-binding NarL/FixJ family response regulator
MTTVALIEDDDAFRDGIGRLLASSGRYRVAGSFGSTEEALQVLPRHPVQLVLCDINLPGQPGPTAVLRLRESCPETRCAMLTIFEDADHLFGALQAGAVGYLLKSEPPEQILAGLDELLAGGAPMSRPVARRVLAAFARPAAAAGCEEVTSREREILDLLARGMTYKEIAGQLGISPPTVKNHLARIYVKLAVRSRTEAVVKWLGR